MKITKTLLLASAVLALAACSSGPSGNISLVDNQINKESSKSGSFTQTIKIDEYRPGCKGECPHLVVDSLVFPGKPKLTALVDHSLALMSWIDEDRPAPYDTVAGLESYFWQTAADRDEIYLSARAIFRNQYLTTVELNVGQYSTGMAHGIKGNQFINWDNQNSVNLSLDDILVSGAYSQYEQVLKQAYSKWVNDNKDQIDDPDNYERMWPFVATNNVAITDLGLLVKYQPYEIAPYSFGEPEILLSYKDLKNIIKARYLPN